MPRKDYLFTSESVSEGHPDKICDRISDAVVDTFLAADPESRVACETLVTKNRIILAGEVRGPETITPDKLEEVARQTVKAIGYEQDDFHWKNAEVCVYIQPNSQSCDIALGVDKQGAGDQGIMFGYACKETDVLETDVLMPAPIHLSHRILKEMAAARHSGDVEGLGPDSKSQVTLQYKDGKPVGADTVLVSTQHAEDLCTDEVCKRVRPFVEKVLPDGWSPKKFLVNPTDRFVKGGPAADAGLTGRKIIVDTYGGAARHGGGAFSGKDPTKVDRSAAYAARYLAKNVVAADLAEKCTIQLSYAIGKPEPLSIYVDCEGTATVEESKLEGALREVGKEVMDGLSPSGIRKRLHLSRPIYEKTAAYGHFGRTPDDDGGFSWEKVDLVDSIRSALT